MSETYNVSLHGEALEGLDEARLRLGLRARVAAVGEAIAVYRLVARTLDRGGRVLLQECDGTTNEIVIKKEQ